MTAPVHPRQGEGVAEAVSRVRDEAKRNQGFSTVFSSDLRLILSVLEARPSLEPPASDVAGWRDLADRLSCHSEYVAAEGVFQMRSVTSAILAEASEAIRALLAAAPPHPASKEPGDE